MNGWKFKSFMYEVKEPLHVACITPTYKSKLPNPIMNGSQSSRKIGDWQGKQCQSALFKEKDF